MRNGLLVAIVVAGLMLTLTAAAEQGAEMSGTWLGPWYRGMTSGIVKIELDDAGSGTIHFTNLENFGEEPVALKNVERDGKKISFSAAGKSGVEFTASATISSEGERMRGNGRYEGFGVRFEARPQKN